MKRTLICLGCLLVANVQAATVLSFDDLATGSPIADGYGGFDWNAVGQFGTANTGAFLGSGYDYGIVSPDNAVHNYFGNPAGLASEGGTDFLFNGAYFTAAWNNGLIITVEGRLDGSLVFTKVFSVDVTAPTWVSFDWAVDALQFSSTGGTNAGLVYGGIPYSGTQFVMDNFTFSAPVPEPGAWAMLLTGLGLVGIAATRRKAV